MSCWEDGPVALAEGGDVGEGLVAGGVVVGVGGPGVGHRRPLLLLVALLSCSLLCFGELHLLPVHQQGLVVERWLQEEQRGEELHSDYYTV